MKMIPVLKKLMKEYSPLALLILVAPFFLPVDRHLHRALLLIFCAGPGLLMFCLDPKTVLKNPVHRCILLFVAYFSAQELRGSLPAAPELYRQLGMQAVMIIFPAIIVSQATPDRKLYPSSIRLILLTAVIGSVYSLVSFYSDNPFPAARFELITGTVTGHPGRSGMRCGFAAALAGAFFLQHGKKSTRTEWGILIGLFMLLTAALYSHTRTSAVALAAVMAAALPAVLKNTKRILLLLAVSAVSLGVYFASLHTDPLAGTPNPPETQLEDNKPNTRHGGIIATGTEGYASFVARVDIWKDLFSRMNSTQNWLIGHGLGRENFVREVSPRARRWHYNGPDGYELHAHSAYIWALYFGGLAGLGLLMLLLAVTARNIYRAGTAGYVPGALLIFGAVSLLVEGKSLLVGIGSSEYLLFWIPTALAAGMIRTAGKDAEKGFVDDHN